MKILHAILLVALFAPLSTAVFAQEAISGYTRSNGTVGQPYVRSAPDGTVTNNYSYQGNTNPSTGQVGTNRYEHDVTSPNYQGPAPKGEVGHSGYYATYGR